jgi:membrane protease subunit HflC
MKPFFFIFCILTALILLKSSLFVVQEGTQVIITEFGKPVGKAIDESGLHVKKPFIQDVRILDKKILTWDGHPNQIPTKDKKYIKVDTTARWRISDPLKLIQTVQDERGAKMRLDAIIDASTRDVISNHNLVECVRNSNAIVEKFEKLVKEQNQRQNVIKNATQQLADKSQSKIASTTDLKTPELLENPLEDINQLIEEEIAGEVEKVHVGREQLAQLILANSDKELEPFGIKLVDVQLRRISYEASVESKVYERMISERQRVAQKIRSIGSGEKAKIEGRLEKDLKEIQSGAYRKSRTLLGQAEAEATEIYALAYQKNPTFFEFLRNLEAIEKSLENSTSKWILSSDHPFLKVLSP